MQITTIGLDLAKHWFQVHGVNANGHIVVRRRLWRSGVIAYFRSLEPCLVGMEACATAHHWAIPKDIAAAPHRFDVMTSTSRLGKFFPEPANKDVNDPGL
jgi:transposase